MNIKGYKCRQCNSVFEVFADDEDIRCLNCDSENVESEEEYLMENEACGMSKGCEGCSGCGK